MCKNKGVGNEGDEDQERTGYLFGEENVHETDNEDNTIEENGTKKREEIWIIRNKKEYMLGRIYFEVLEIQT